MAAAAARVAVRVKRWPVNLGGDEDPYTRLTTKFPAESERILDDVLGKLMLDGWVYSHFEMRLCFSTQIHLKLIDFCLFFQILARPEDSCKPRCDRFCKSVG
jgi:hypothetical protein